MVYELIIIGAGPAGITAAIYAARKRLNFLVITRVIGGQLMNNAFIENYTGYQEISGAELVSKFEEHLKEFKFDLEMDEVINISIKNDIFQVRTKSNVFKSKTLIIAAGTSPRKLNVKGEEEFLNRGVTYCATCDGPLFLEKDVAIIGGGNSAFETAIQLMAIANKIYMIDIAEDLIGDKILIDKVRAHAKVEIFSSSSLKAIKGDKFVEKIEFEQKGQIKIKNVQGVFIEIGYIPQTSIFKDLVELNVKDEIITDRFKKTSRPGVFAAGDCTDTPFKQIIISGGEGAVAALSAFQFLSKI